MLRAWMMFLVTLRTPRMLVRIILHVFLTLRWLTRSKQLRVQILFLTKINGTTVSALVYGKPHLSIP